MVRHSANSLDRRVGFRSVALWRADAIRRPLRSRLVVIAPSARDAVRRLGGWLFDMTTAGWEVTVAVADHSDIRSLEILGVLVVDLEQMLAMPLHESNIDTLAVATGSYRSDDRVRDGVLECVNRGGVRTMFWGADLPREFDGAAESARHRVSVAGRAFTACALRAAGLAAEVTATTETLWTAQVPARDVRQLTALLSAS
ncbi:hypothetical protein [Nocardia sp. NPDC005366]|uniref:hypothetical protein n=1 Tax=Nocardia sp. NPDC005366 TaxID=3156878 RepID=UPI0033ADD9B3